MEALSDTLTVQTFTAVWWTSFLAFGVLLLLYTARKLSTMTVKHVSQETAPGILNYEHVLVRLTGHESSLLCWRLAWHHMNKWTNGNGHIRTTLSVKKHFSSDENLNYRCIVKNWWPKNKHNEVFPNWKDNDTEPISVMDIFRTKHIGVYSIVKTKFLAANAEFFLSGRSHKYADKCILIYTADNEECNVRPDRVEATLLDFQFLPNFLGFIIYKNELEKSYFKYATEIYMQFGTLSETEDICYRLQHCIMADGYTVKCGGYTDWLN